MYVSSEGSGKSNLFAYSVAEPKLLLCWSMSFVLSLQDLLPDTGQTSQNSLSLSRAPGHLTNDIRGSSLNFPFWPGMI